MPRRRSKSEPESTRGPARVPPAELRIIAGRFRGRKLHYSGNRGVRPMKERVREALFNILAGLVPGKHAVDLFAGTGALGLEALSRGARGVTFIERDRETAATLRRNVTALAASDEARVLETDAFAWAATPPVLGSDPWLVFCSPPYEFFVSRTTDLLAMLARLLAASPPASVMVVEADERFDFTLLPHAEQWDIRRYPPAILGIFEKSNPSAAEL